MGTGRAARGISGLGPGHADTRSGGALGRARSDACRGVAAAGQGAFAAIAEIVLLLQADPETDWSKVDIGALREHLVDMNELTLNAVAREEPIPGGVQIEVTGEGRTLRAIHNMVPAHAAELAKLEGWQAEAATRHDGARLTATSTDPRQEAQIRGLGFFGLMATGAHHQTHHWAMATGQPMHGH